MTAHTFVIHNGVITAIYADALLPVFDALGVDAAAHTTRASHVEPTPEGWVADMAPVGGPMLPAQRTRQAALDAEVEWLRHNL